MTSFLVVGRVVDRQTGRVVGDGQVAFYQQRRRTPVGTTSIDERGMFRFELSDERLAELFGAEPERTELDVRVSRNGDLLRIADGSGRWKLPSERTFLRIAVDIPAEEASKKRIVVNSYDDLLQHEEEILERINRAPSGPHRFLLEPFKLLDDVGVRLTPTARDQILKRHTGLRSVSATPYVALTQSTRRQSLRFRIRSLKQGARSAR